MLCYVVLLSLAVIVADSAPGVVLISATMTRSVCRQRLRLQQAETHEAFLERMKARLASCVGQKATLKRIGGDWDPREGRSRTVSTLELAVVPSVPEQGDSGGNAAVGAALREEGETPRTPSSNDADSREATYEERLKAWHRAATLYQGGKLWEALAAFEDVCRIAPKWARPRLYVGLLNRCAPPSSLGMAALSVLCVDASAMQWQ